ncbi:MAG TPA: PsbP-related protein [Pyrinomonadaceae bacterium]|nr:PsbP-related protein [Pyrinomonadaceae bacterium]
MKSLSYSLATIALLAMWSMPALAQTPAEGKQLSKDGLSFTYPNGWTMVDESNADAQNFNLGRADSDAQIRVFVFRTPVTTPERFAEAKKVLIDPYVASTVRQFEQMGAKPQKSPASTEIATVASEGVRIAASLEGVPGAAEIYWGVVGNRLVVLTQLGPDRALKQVSSAWDAIRNSIAIADPTPAPRPAPAATPTATPTATPKPGVR